MPSQPDRSVLLDPTKNLVDSMKTNNVGRIKSAINMPCVDLNIRIPKHQQMTILMRFCYLDITSKSRKDLVNLVFDVSSRSPCDLNAQDLTGKTLLTHACLQQDEDMIKLLAKNGMVDPDVGDDEGNTPLMHACRTGNASVVKTLIVSFKKWGLNVNATNNEGISPLHEAARLGHTNVIRTLVIDGDADVNQRDKNRNCAQDYLVVNGKGLTCDLLLLCPTAQRKRLARERRVAEGRRSMMDLVNESSIPRTSAWVSEDSKHKKSKMIVTQGTQPSKTVTGLTSFAPLTQEYAGQLNSVVFQLAQCIPMLAEKPLEEDVENVEKSSPSRRLSSMSEMEEFQQYLFDKYIVNGVHNDVTLEKESSSSKCSEKRSVSTKHEVFDGRLRLQPIKDGDGQDHENAPAMNSRYHRQRRSSLPTDIPKFTTDLEDHTIQRSQSFSSRDVPNSGRDQAKHPTGRKGSAHSLNDSLSGSPPKSNLPTSPRPNKVAMSKNADPPSPSSKTATRLVRRLSDEMDTPSDVNRPNVIARRSSLSQLDSINQSPVTTSTSPNKPAMSTNSEPPYTSSKTATRPVRRLSDEMDKPSEPNRPNITTRRSSLPQIDTSNSNNQSSLTTSTSPRRRSTYPAKIKKSEPISIVHRPRAIESRVTTSWEGKSSKAVPSYLFR
ncbi:uncharacterized protein [Amphiura filiformis]|uniref:uncharacterized protein n=1 Tax=Amphiura filiformis TaxID=82378 RepID=UPI003B219865